MDGVVRILRKFVGSTILVSVVLLLFNLILLGSLIFKEIHEGPSPGAVVKQMASGLSKGEQGDYALNSDGMQLLDTYQAWAMLLDPQGKVQWSERLPAEIPRSYDVTDVAKFSRYYLKEYPVYVWEREDGLLVVGYPKNTYGKYQFDFLAEWLKSLPIRIILLLVCNVALALLVSILIGTRVIRSIRPLIHGIHALAKEEPVHVETKGIFNDLSQSINSTSRMLQDKDDALKARDEARSNWIAGISHDIRTPLSMILGYASELEEQSDLSAEHKQQASIIRRQGERLRSLVSDLNLVSMLEYEMQPLQLKSIRLSVLARQAVSDFLNNGLDERYPISLHVQDESLHVMGDERLLYRAVTNLVQNSITHNPEGCAIVLETMRAAEDVCCEFVVSDDGKGIPKEYLDDVVVLPYAAGRVRPSRQGHGLGLPMVSRIAQAHRGKLILESDSGEGLRAALQLPAT
ncbi:MULTISPECIES: sensor histidine kinase [Paenibacillus]|uniref:sensor histidine kinase n=1 Tax=Paenibacillus TaxID=44249 RepID=UPI0009380E3C|nr:MULTISPECIES: HAMP domain-containing sensor histidine kinase [Paenibacillus]APO43549.1 two-component sensor histidine kinase [Paenibacillus xylanexedens]MCL6662752.1 HAMP domain-containing histidine kinase [Paenibacillus amylolyticus]WJM08777.1 HAMP domain-containing sensor histidine kinase [Paenibacillus sp. PK1-4R]